MSVYDKENPAYLKESIESVLDQTLKANEIVIVKDGILNEGLKKVLEEYEKRNLITTIQLKENVGLGKALSIGIEECSYELIARMDSDDICEPHRFEKQLRYMEEHPETAVCGGQIAEFVDHKEAIVGKRIVPIGHEEIARYARRRNPMNHVTTMFRKSSILSVGNYESLLGFEDYLLWMKLIDGKYQLHNLDDVLVYVRTDFAFQDRRGGFRYFKQIIQAQWNFYTRKFINLFEFFLNSFIRGTVCIIPKRIRNYLYKNILRKKG